MLGQMKRMGSILLEHLFENLDMAPIARNTGTRARSLQRKFRSYFGETVFEFVLSARKVRRSRFVTFSVGRA